VEGEGVHGVDGEEGRGGLRRAPGEGGRGLVEAQGLRESVS